MSDTKHPGTDPQSPTSPAAEKKAVVVRRRRARAEQDATPATKTCRRRDASTRKKDKTPPTPKRIRCWQRRRDWANHQEKRRQARDTGQWVRTLIAQIEARGGDRSKLFPYYVPEALAEFKNATATALIGWVAFAWMLRGHAQLVGSYAELAVLVECSDSTAERWMVRLCEHGWIAKQHHYDEKRKATWQECNSYGPGRLLLAALGAATERKRRNARASFFVPDQQDPHSRGSVVSLPSTADTASDARGRARSVSPTATLGVRRSQNASSTPLESTSSETQRDATDGAMRVEVGEGQGTGVESSAIAQDEASAPRNDTAPQPDASPPGDATQGISCDGAPAGGVDVFDAPRPRPAYPGRTVVVQTEIDRLLASGRSGDGKAWLELWRLVGLLDRGPP